MPKLNTEEMVASVKSRTLAPTSQKTWADAEIISILNEELFLGLVPDIQSVREDFFKTKILVPLIQDKTEYRLPERALGSSVEDVVCIDGSGNRYPLSRMNSRDLTNIRNQVPTYYAYILVDQTIKLLPSIYKNAVNLEIRYARRPSKIVPTSRTAIITAITDLGATIEFGVNTDLTEFLSASQKIDLYPTKSPFSIWFQDVEIVSITSSAIVVNKNEVVNEINQIPVSIGDALASANETNLLMLPEEFDPILPQQAAIYLLEALGESQKIQIAYPKLERMRKAAFKLIANRVENSVQCIRRRGGFRGTLSAWGVGGN
jgi:hypothetical protein